MYETADDLAHVEGEFKREFTFPEEISAMDRIDLRILRLLLEGRMVCSPFTQRPHVPLTDEEIAGSTDWVKVRKYYKLNGAPTLSAITDEPEREKEMAILVLGAMALRGL